jgi:hypothetical protein
MSRERRLTEESPADRFAFSRAEAGTAVSSHATEVGGEQIVTNGGMARPARWTVTARLIGEYDRVAGRYGLHGGADPLDDARALVPQNDWHGSGDMPSAHVQVCLADAGGNHPYQNLVRARLFQSQLLEPQRLAELT